MKRRTFIEAAVAGVVAPAALTPGFACSAAAPSVARGGIDFHSSDDREALRAVFGEMPVVEDGVLELEVPRLKADREQVPVSIGFAGHAPGQVALIAVPSSRPVCAVLTASPGLLGFRTVIRMPRSGTVRAYGADARVLHRASASVVVTLGGYGMVLPHQPEQRESGYGPLSARIRARSIGETTRLVAVVDAPPGARRTPPSPGGGASARRMCFTMNEVEIARVVLGPAAALDQSFVGLTLRGAMRGRELTVAWADDDGRRGTASSIVA